MDPKSVNIWDLRRIIIGDVPTIFLLEVIIRIFFIYFLLVFSMRLMGKRMAGTMNRNELAAMVSLAAAIGVPMQEPGSGLLPAIIIALIVVGIQKTVAKLTLKNKNFESATQGDLSVLIEDGCLKLEELEKEGFPRERIYAQLRGYGVCNLGMVKRLYLESSGGFTLLKNPKTTPGLSIVPAWDKEYLEQQEHDDTLFACTSCGNTTPSEDESQKNKPCEKCGATDKVVASKI